MTVKSVGKITSNLHIIKAFLYDRRIAVPLDEIVLHVADKMEGSTEPKIIRERYVLPVLEKQDYYRSIRSNKWQIVEDLMPEYKNILQVFDKEQAFLSSTDAKSKLAAILDIRSSHVVYDFQRDKRMVKVRGKWGPANWVIINDKAADLLKDFPQGLTEKELLKMIRERNQKEFEDKIIVFHPDKDDRFSKERKTWVLQSFKEKEKEREQSSSLSRVNVPIHTERKVSDDLEKTFSTVVVKQTGTTSKQGQKTSQSRLIKQQVAQMLSQSQKRKELEDSKPKPVEPVVPAVSEPEVITDSEQEIAVQDLSANSFFVIEKNTREKNVAVKTRDEINKLLSELAPDSEALTGTELGKGKASAHKIEHIILKHYENVKESRLLVPDQYNRFLVELIKPNLSNLTVIPCVHTGRLMVSLLEYLWNSLADGKWSFGEDEEIQLTQKDGFEYSIDAEESELIEIARDNNIVGQSDLLNHFLDYNFIGIETDTILTKTSRLVSTVLGFENAVIFNKDYFSQLPQILGHEPNDTNSIDERFDIILGNFLFTNENTTANYIDQSMQILDSRGRLGCFVNLDFLQLLPGHPFLRSILSKTRITHIIKLPRESDNAGEVNNLVLLILSGLDYSEIKPDQTEVLCAWAEPLNEEALLQILEALKSNEENDGITYIEQSKIERKIIDSTKESVDG